MTCKEQLKKIMKDFEAFELENINSIDKNNEREFIINELLKYIERNYKENENDKDWYFNAMLEPFEEFVNYNEKYLGLFIDLFNTDNEFDFEYQNWLSNYNIDIDNENVEIDNNTKIDCMELAIATIIEYKCEEKYNEIYKEKN